MARRKMTLTELSERVNITPANLSILKTGKAKAIRFSTLEAICRELECQPGEILEFRRNWLIHNRRCGASAEDKLVYTMPSREEEKTPKGD